MPTTRKTPARKTAAKKTATAPAKDAVTMLRADHKKVSGLFAEFDKARATTKKRALVAQICAELSVHAQVEEEIFYPAVKAALKDHALIPEAVVEQATMKALIGQVEGVEPDGEMYDAKVKVLAEYVKHHVKEEHTEMFPRAKATRLDLMALGAQMAARKSELLAGKA